MDQANESGELDFSYKLPIGTEVVIPGEYRYAMAERLFEPGAVNGMSKLIIESIGRIPLGA